MIYQDHESRDVSATPVMSHFSLPEILSPAGNLDKLKTSVLYGADAVYLAGQEFGLRTAADNFTDDELIEGLQFAHNRGTKAYIVLNGFLHDQDLQKLPPFLSLLESAGADAVIVSDLGVIDCVQKHSSLPIHLSTQASCLNASAGKFWKDRGVKRLILGREVSIEEARIIKQETGLEVEVFIHGSLCMAYSGNCTISNFTQGRDSNRGGCAQSCRFDYSLDFDLGKNSLGQKNVNHSFFMSSRDLASIHLIPELVNSGIDSLKIEGRMKSVLYTAVTTRVYKEALHMASKSRGEADDLQNELLKIVNRTYTSGNLSEKADRRSIISLESDSVPQRKAWSYAGDVVEVVEDEFILLEVRNAFYAGSVIELLPWSGPAISVPLDWMTDILGNPIERSNVNRVVRIPFVEGVEARNVARMAS